jgi:glutathione S-transferase
MLKFHFNPGPNPAKVALFLEEALLPYQIIAVDLRKGEKFKPDFLALNPNALRNLKRWFDYINARPAAVRANALKDRFNFKAEMDEEARRNLFRHLPAKSVVA